jgi:pimeloyl-ACP methyl ester carboxylesterase
MPYADSSGVKLYYEETGHGRPIVFSHEFGADGRTWEQQVRYLGRHYRCITINARGYPPSEVPRDPERYGYEASAGDIRAVLDHLGIDQAHVVGLSMGAYASLAFGLANPGRAGSLVLSGIGSGSMPGGRAEFETMTSTLAQAYRTQGSAAAAALLGGGATRLQLLDKDPRGYAESMTQLAEHSALGAALTMERFQRLRPGIPTFEAQLQRLEVPTLVLCGDEDEPCIEPSLYLKRTLPNCGLQMVPRSGHALNLEEPALFNRSLLDFFGLVERGQAYPRDAQGRRRPAGLR